MVKINRFFFKQQKKQVISEILQTSYHPQQYCDLKYSEQRESLLSDSAKKFPMQNQTHPCFIFNLQ